MGQGQRQTCIGLRKERLMSGPKRARWFLVYDPTPKRLTDLARFALKLDRWLGNHQEFVGEQLGEDAVGELFSARDAVGDCIEARNADAGFDAYGRAWATFNELHRRASQERRRRQAERREQELREMRRREMEARRREDAARKQREAGRRQKEAARKLVEQCRAAWKADGHTLRDWGRQGDHERASGAVSALSRMAPGRAIREARSWLEGFHRMVSAAERRERDNAEAVAAILPGLHERLQELGSLNAGVLTQQQQEDLDRQKAAFVDEADRLQEAQALGALQDLATSVAEYLAKFVGLVKEAEFRKAAEAWKDALGKSGYSVNARTEPDGTVVLEASSFPMKSVRVRMTAESQEAELNVDGSSKCVQDVKSLQAELANRGLELTVTDWGKGEPQQMYHQVAQTISAGGQR